MTYQIADQRHPFMGLDNEVCKKLFTGVDYIKSGYRKKMSSGRNTDVKMILI